MRVNTLRLLGETVRVHRGGIVWDCKADGVRYVIGETRIEALENLRKMKSEHIERLPTSLGVELGAPSTDSRPDKEDAPSRAARAYKCAFYYAKARAKRSGKDLMSETDFWSLVERANGRCEVTGIKFSSERVGGLRVAAWSPSIDRIDGAKGYSVDNCRLVCVSVNMALNEFGVEVLLRIANALMSSPTAIDIDPRVKNKGWKPARPKVDLGPIEAPAAPGVPR